LVLSERLNPNKERTLMTTLTDWIMAGAGLAIGKLIVATAVIVIVTALLAVFFIIEERTK
jgi:hypothetical protein